jgi:hypothetical protein
MNQRPEDMPRPHDEGVCHRSSGAVMKTSVVDTTAASSRLTITVRAMLTYDGATNVTADRSRLVVHDRARAYREGAQSNDRGRSGREPEALGRELIQPAQVLDDRNLCGKKEAMDRPRAGLG